MVMSTRLVSGSACCWIIFKPPALGRRRCWYGAFWMVFLCSVKRVPSGKINSAPAPSPWVLDSFWIIEKSLTRESLLFFRCNLGKLSARQIQPIIGTHTISRLIRNLTIGPFPVITSCTSGMSNQDWWLQITTGVLSLLRSPVTINWIPTTSCIHKLSRRTAFR